MSVLMQDSLATRRPRPAALPRGWRLAVLLGPAVICLQAGGGRAVADEIVLANGQALSGVKIVSARWDNVQYTKNGAGAATTVAGDRVSSIDRSSTWLGPGRIALQHGDYLKAVKELSSVGAKAEAWEQAEAKYLTGQAHQMAGNSKEAQSAFKAYLEKHQAEKDWWVPAAVHALGEVLLEAKQPQSAEARFKELAQFGGQWDLLSKLGLGMAILASKGEAGALEARRLFDDVARSRDAPLPLKQKAVVARGEAFLLQKQTDSVLKELGREFFEAPKPGELSYSPERARATLLIGKAYMAMGGKENLEQAEIWLLRVPALYRRQTEVHREACDLLVDLYGKMGKKTRAAEWQARRPGAPAPAANGPEARGKP